MDKYTLLKNFIINKSTLVKETFPNNEDAFGNGMKEAFRKILEEIQKIENSMA